MNRRYLFKIILLFSLIFILQQLYTFISILDAESKERIKISKITTASVEEVVEEDSEYNNNAKAIYRDNLKNEENTKNTSTSTEASEENKKNNELPSGFDVIISIPSIELEKIVYTGKNREEHLKEYELITAAPDMQYKHGGNYIICGHTSRIYGHSLNRLKEVKTGDEVYIRNNNLIDKYIVISIDYEQMKNTSTFCKQTEDNQLTILSCANHIADDKYTVVKCKKIN